jgi:hypothetical protein
MVSAGFKPTPDSKTVINCSSAMHDNGYGVKTHITMQM